MSDKIYDVPAEWRWQIRCVTSRRTYLAGAAALPMTAAIAQLSLDLRAISSIRPVPDDQALAGAKKLLDVAGLGGDFAARPMLSSS